MHTRISFPVLTVVVAGSLVAACGGAERVFVTEDGGSPPVDGSPRIDATDASSAVDQQGDSGGGNDGKTSDTPLTEASADTRVDARVDVAADASTADAAAPDTAADTVVMDTVVIDAGNPDSGIDDVAVIDTAPDVTGPDDAGYDAGDDVNSDGVDCSSTSPPRISPNGNVGVCPGKTITLTSSSAPSYFWSTGATTPSIDVGAAGSYTVTTTDARGCMATSAPTVVSAYPTPATPIITASGATQFCMGSSVTLTSTGASGYLWSNGATTQSIVVTNSGSYTVTTTDPNGCSATSAATSVTVIAPTPGSQAFSFTGAAANFVVPTCVTSILVDAYGAQGGASNAAGLGGQGGYVSAVLAVTPGATLQIRVGGAGTLCNIDNTGGWNGGGPANCTGYPNGSGGTYYSATGGGATDLRVTPYTLDDRVIVAGAGGGAGYNCLNDQDSGGIGGGLIGGKFPTTCGAQPDSAGSGGTQAAGGIGGTYPSYGYAGSGSYGYGGSGVSTGGSAASEGGGGGAGYFGGGGGCWVGGGGGSDYVRTTVAVLRTQSPGSRVGNGALLLTWPAP